MDIISVYHQLRPYPAAEKVVDKFEADQAGVR